MPLKQRPGGLPARQVGTCNGGKAGPRGVAATDPSCLRAGACCPRGDGEGPGRLSHQPHPRAWGAAAQLLEDEREWQAVPRVRVSLSLLLVRVLQRKAASGIYIDPQEEIYYRDWLM